MRPKLLDLFCGAGGASMGYYRAGFDVTGIDVKPQPRYPFKFIHADALKPPVNLKAFDAIHASPPCQAFTALKSMWNSRPYPDLVAPTRNMLIDSGKPWIMENVEGSPLINPMVLCGTMFGLMTEDQRAELRRHRLFESRDVFALLPPCRHNAPMVIGVYGGHGRDRRRSVNVYGHSGGKSVRDGVQQFSTKQRSEAMGIEWMTGKELSQAIPPAYTEFIGKQLLQAL